MDILAFYRLIQDLNLVNLDTSNETYTWNNKRGGKHQIASWLDRYLLSENLMQGRWNIKNIILRAAGSDHWPININFEIQIDKNAKPFRFDKFWLNHLDFANNIKTWCKEISNTEGTLMYHFQQRLKKIKVRLKKWNKVVFGNVHQAKKEMEIKMETIQHEMIRHG